MLAQLKGLIEQNGPGSPLSNSLRDQILAQYPENRERTELKIALMEFRASIPEKSYDKTELIDHKKLSEMAEPLIRYLEEGTSVTENKWEIEWLLAQFFLEFGEPNEAKRHLEMAFALAPLEPKLEIKSTLESLYTPRS